VNKEIKGNSTATTATATLTSPIKKDKDDKKETK